MIKKDIDSAYGRDLTMKDFTSVTADENRFEAGFSPNHPAIGGRFVANWYRYQSNSPGSLSLFGRILRDDGEWEHLAFVLRADLSDGRYPIGPYGSDVSAILAHSTGGSLVSAYEGEFDFQRNPAANTIVAKFHFKLTERDVTYQVDDGTLYLHATGAL
ncbi:hypothetical protein GIW70_09755 [Pseudomonas syringae]|nr:hypothetical protein [Pseudomonas syringae]MCF5068482.1 hypothetical protein [Pseudomonas syringae]